MIFKAQLCIVLGVVTTLNPTGFNPYVIRICAIKMFRRLIREAYNGLCRNNVYL
jgi:hypothetical protein